MYKYNIPHHPGKRRTIRFVTKVAKIKIIPDYLAVIMENF